MKVYPVRLVTQGVSWTLAPCADEFDTRGLGRISLEALRQIQPFTSLFSASLVTCSDAGPQMKSHI